MSTYAMKRNTVLLATILSIALILRFTFIKRFSPTSFYYYFSLFNNLFYTLENPDNALVY